MSRQKRFFSALMIATALLLPAVAMAAAPPESGNYSRYLAGTFEVGPQVAGMQADTIVWVVNPFAKEIEVCTTFFAEDGTGLGGLPQIIKPNGLIRVDAAKYASAGTVGTVKVLVYQGPGAVGFAKDIVRSLRPTKMPATIATSTNLAAVPSTLVFGEDAAAKAEYTKIRDTCKKQGR